MSVSSPVFPYEIFDLITDYFGSHPDYKRDLITLGNVSTAFSHMRQRHLFWEVMLDESCPEQYAQLEQLMASNPRISTLPRRLVIHNSRLGSSSDASSPPSLRANVYLQFPNINELAILGLPIESYHTGAENVGRNTSLSLQALHRMVDNGCLTSLTLLHIHDLPIILILSQPHLVHLDLRACYAAAWHEFPPSPAVQAAGFKLKTCTLSGRLKYTVSLALLYCRGLQSLAVGSPLFSRGDAEVPRYHIPPAMMSSALM
ncbi:hypothetical protein BJ165DRAFT_1490170 [Panaeolus papilionaceus]|nr:hypothetical protein BJ165DRAFT_1490170 [Panaeolus papilionaceus]